MFKCTLMLVGDTPAAVALTLLLLLLLLWFNSGTF